MTQSHVQPLFQYIISHDLLLGAGAAGVHGADPFKLVAGLEVFGHALGAGELSGDELDLLLRLAVNVHEVLCQGAFHQHHSEGVRLMLLEEPLEHASVAADVAFGLLGHGEAGVIVVADEIVGEAVRLVIDGCG